MLSVFVHQSKNDIVADRPSNRVDYLYVGKFFNYEVKETDFLLNVYKNVNYRLSKEQAASRFINLNPVAIEVSTSI